MSVYYYNPNQSTPNVGSSDPANGGNPAQPSYNDGINWPINPTDTTDYNGIFGYNPNNTLLQNELQYQRALNWLKSNPDSYNADIAFLKMTVDMGNNCPGMQGFLANELQVPGAETFLQQVLQMAADGAAIGTGSQPNSLAQGIAAAQSFLSSFMSSISNIKGEPPFNELFEAAQSASSYMNVGTSWAQSMYGTYKEPATGQIISTWLVNGGPSSGFSSWANMAAGNIGGVFLDPPSTSNNSNINQVLNAEMASIIQQALAALAQMGQANTLAAIPVLMGILNQEDLNTGVAINGLGNINNLQTLANTYINKMFGDVNNPTPANVADFYQEMSNLQTLVQENPQLQPIWSTLQSQITTLNNQMAPGTSSSSKTPLSWTVGSGVYTFPPGTTFTYTAADGQKVPVTIPANATPAQQQVYLSGGTVSIDPKNLPSNGFTLGQLAGMGDFSTIATTMAGWQSSNTIMSTFTDQISALATTFNSMQQPTNAALQLLTSESSGLEQLEQAAFGIFNNLDTQINTNMSQANS